MGQDKKISADKIIIAVILIAFILLVSVIYITKRQGQLSLDGSYSLSYASTSSDGSDSSVKVTVSFDSSTGEYVETWNDSPFSTGTYTVNDDRVVVTTDATDTYDSEEIVYLLDGDVLVPEDYLYEGEIPDKDLFSAELIMDDGSQVTTVTFNEDGTFTVAVASDNTETSVSGTYERDGDYIKRTTDDGSSLTPFYLYQGNTLAGIAYTKD
ncbi:MAG: hypothetical protein K6E13_09465 [Lachnospiraceae bacterium]|nr:hypothetical protein [Lachnospiraceae bacterium]